MERFLILANEEIRLALAARLNDSDPDVRGEAMRGLPLRRDARGEEPILQELRSPDCTDQAIEAACELKSERFRRELERLLELTQTRSTFDSPSTQYPKRCLRSSKALLLADMSVMTYNALHAGSRQAACLASGRSKDAAVFEGSAR